MSLITGLAFGLSHSGMAQMKSDQFRVVHQPTHPTDSTTRAVALKTSLISLFLRPITGTVFLHGRHVGSEHEFPADGIAFFQVFTLSEDMALLSGIYILSGSQGTRLQLMKVPRTATQFVSEGSQESDDDFVVMDDFGSSNARGSSAPSIQAWGLAGVNGSGSTTGHRLNVEWLVPALNVRMQATLKTRDVRVLLADMQQDIHSSEAGFRLL